MSHFFIIGAQRCGTSFIANCLDSHPQIEISKPLKPEPKFFLEKSKWNKGLDYYKDNLFTHSDSVKVYGEKSTSYIENQTSLLRIKKFFPQAKVLIILRNPIYRALSNYKFSVDSGLEKLPIEEALTKDPKDRKYSKVSVNPFDYISRGHYMNYIDEVTKIFHPNNIYIQILEELAENNFINLFEWLEVESTFVIDHKLIDKNSALTNIKLSKDSKEELIRIYKESVFDLEGYLNKKIIAWKDFI